MILPRSDPHGVGCGRMNRRFLASIWTLVSTRKSTKLKSTFVDVDELIDGLLDVDRPEDERR